MIILIICSGQLCPASEPDALNLRFLSDTLMSYPSFPRETGHVKRAGMGPVLAETAASPSPFPLALPPLFSVPHFPPGARGLMLPRDLLCRGGSGGNQQCF